ncbi:MAG: hypothetical protein INR71_03170 [Terriglobus roseus]|nr:hypothetical protein [Terriglobus roseus]
MPDLEAARQFDGDETMHEPHSSPHLGYTPTAPDLESAQHFEGDTPIREPHLQDAAPTPDRVNPADVATNTTRYVPPEENPALDPQEHPFPSASAISDTLEHTPRAATVAPTGTDTPIPPSTPKSVHFNIPDTASTVSGAASQLRHEPRHSRHHDDPFDSSPERFRHHRRRHSDTANDYREDRRRDRKGKQRRADSPDSDGSGDTIELPARFDERGRKIPETEEERLTMQVDDFLKGRNTAGRIFRSFADDFLSGHGSSSRSRR